MDNLFEPQIISYTRSREDGSIQNRHLNNIANTIHGSTGHGGNTDSYVAEFDTSKIKYVGQMSSSQNSRVIDIEGISYAVTNGHKDGEPKILEYQNQPVYKIRKLTERECFRLMGIDDADIDKIQASGVSRTQQYKMAGNSIVVDCLYHIFRKLYIEPQCEHQQLTLF